MSTDTAQPAAPKYTPEQIAAAAAQWWGDAIRARRRGSSGEATFDMLAVVASKRDPEPDHADRVQQAIADAVLARLRDGARRIFLSVDYGAEGLLLDAIRAAGVAPTLPMKTTMYVTPDGIDVSCGYRAPYAAVPLNVQPHRAAGGEGT